LSEPPVSAAVDLQEAAAQCRQIIRNFATPSRLRKNPLAQAILARMTADQTPRRVLETSIDEALGHLSLRDRKIVRRCDFDCEAPGPVAADLGISVRHLYRERQRIFQKLAVLLQEARRPSRAAVAVEATSSIDDLVKTSRSLEENGAHAIAASILERRASECVATLERTRLFLWLAQLHARSGSIARANECVEIACRHADQELRPRPLLQAEVAFTCAFVREEAAEYEPAVKELAETSIHLVRSGFAAGYDASAAAILVRALALRVGAASFTGDLKCIASSVREIQETLPYLSEADADSQMAALFAEFHAKVLCQNDLEGSAQCLGRAIQAAQNAGLSTSSIMLGVNLASVHRMCNDPKRAIEVLSTRLDVARVLGNTKVLGAVLIELGSAYVDLREYARARSVLDEALVLAESARSRVAPYLRASARVSLGMHHFARALDDSRAAEAAYAALGKDRLVGSSLKLQAEALMLSGNRRAALIAARNAIDQFACKSEHSALAAAYVLLGRLTGSTRYFDTARALRGPNKRKS
jgi:tetratricopeptide (TPR) repeat protein